MPVDPCFTALLADKRNELRPPPPHVTLGDMRKANERFLAAAPAPPIHEIQDRYINEVASGPRLRIYRPTNADSLPATVFVHGGAFVMGSIESHDSICRRLALFSEEVVVSVDYRLAPETPFPGAVDDCCAALDFIAEHGSELGIDTRRLALAGDSAGANLATAAALKTATSGGHRIRHLTLIYPVTDSNCDTPSMLEYGTGYMLTRAAMQWAWGLYVRDASDLANPLASILRGDLASLASLPSTTVMTAEYDPLRDEGELFAARLRSAGVPVELRRYEGMVHGFVGLPHLTPTADEALRDAARIADRRASIRIPPRP